MGTGGHPGVFALLVYTVVIVVVLTVLAQVVGAIWSGVCDDGTPAADGQPRCGHADCGRFNPRGARFCGRCGRRLIPTDAEAHV
jgi:hypothetical protein